MLRPLNGMIGFRLLADNKITSKVSDFLFAAPDWRVQYVVLTVGVWLHKRSILVPWTALNRPVGRMDVIPVNLTREDLKHCSELTSLLPLPRFNHRAHEPGWSDHGQPRFPLCSAEALQGATVEGMDGRLGVVDDLIVDDEDWQLHYYVLRVARPEHDHLTLAAVHWTEQFLEKRNTVGLDLSRETVHNSPPYEPSAPINRDYDGNLVEYSSDVPATEKMKAAMRSKPHMRLCETLSTLTTDGNQTVDHNTKWKDTTCAE